MNFPGGATQSLLEHFNPTERDVRDIFKEIRQHEWSQVPVGGTAEFDVNNHSHILSNGLSIGEFCMWYIASNRTLCEGNTATAAKNTVKKSVTKKK
jgi:hypothetical protein